MQATTTHPYTGETIYRWKLTIEGGKTKIAWAVTAKAAIKKLSKYKVLKCEPVAAAIE